jgi:hypothetical protein
VHFVFDRFLFTDLCLYMCLNKHFDGWDITDILSELTRPRPLSQAFVRGFHVHADLTVHDLGAFGVEDR